ncbi:MAG: SCO family protein [Bacteroidetes bacterium]|nr:MAG: SCO family protein [Bacteroidota bacterium]
MMKRTLIPLLALCTMALRANPADTVKPAVEVGIDEKVGQTLPMDLVFYDEKGYRRTLREVVTKPTILNFVYYRCPGICSPILTELTTIVNFMDLEIGKDYQILTVSFDEREKPELAKAKQESYFNLLNRPVPDGAWRWMTGDSASIRTLTDAAGFMFKKEGNDFIHAGTVIAVSPEGKIARYLYGTKYLPFDVKMAVTEAAEGRTGPTITKILSYCYTYNPDGRNYVFNVTRVAGAVILLFAAVFVIYITVKPKKVQS